ncbi:MAG: NAD(P)-binding domain-containing protein [Flavisolibacter sp.]|nr:NAD(P)-binding domain-containing protein [Flavisolibacter sp.]
MKIAIIGTGRMGKALLKTFYQSYPDSILFSSRSKQKAQEVIQALDLYLEAASMEEAMKADIIIPTLWCEDLLPWLAKNKEQLKGKIIIDITNPFNASFDDFTTAYDTSSAEEVQKMVPQSTVVGAFKNTYFVVFDQPLLQGLKSDLYVTSDHEQALDSVIEALKPLPFRVLNAGSLKNNRTIERMTLLSGELARKAGNYPRVSFNLWGLEHEGL